MIILYLLLFSALFGSMHSVANEQVPTKKPLPKDPLFMTELDMENLYDQWEEADDEKLPPDELEPHKRPPPKIDPRVFADADTDMETKMRLSKKGKNVMAFVNIAGNPSRQETEDITHRWQLGLQNAHVRVQRFIIENNRALFLFEDGIQAYEYKDYLLSQPELSEYVIEGRSFHGKGYPVEYPHANKGNKDNKENYTSDKTNVVKSKRAKHDEL